MTVSKFAVSKFTLSHSSRILHSFAIDGILPKIEAVEILLHLFHIHFPAGLIIT